MGFVESFVAFANDILWSYILIVMLVGYLVFLQDQIRPAALPERNVAFVEGGCRAKD